MRFKLYPLALFLFGCLFGINLNAQVIINEFSASNMNIILDNYGDNEDWIELYNAGTDPVDLEGYFLSDDIDEPDSWAIPAGVNIGPGEYLIIYCSNLNEFTGGLFLHSNFKLTQMRQEYVVFSDPTGVVLDAFQMANPTQMDHSRGRITDGAAEWGVFLNPTPGGSNSTPYLEYAPKPTFTTAPGFYGGSVVVGIEAEPGLEIRYTTDGSEPDQNSDLYDNPLIFDVTTVVKAITYSNDPTVPPSFVEANTYFVNDFHTVTVLSIAGSNLQNLLNGNQFNPVGSFEYFSADGQLIDEAYGEYNKHGNDSWAYPQRGIDYITRDQMGHASSIEHKIFPTKDRMKYQRFMIKAAANDNYPYEDGAHIRDSYVHHLSQLADMELDERSWAPCVLYLNGEYWGVYDIREKVDDPDFTSEYYDQGAKWIDYIKTWGNTWEEYGSKDDWDDLHDFITNNSMADPANYAIAAEQLNMTSLVDYMILNTHVVCMDWLNWNTAWWRGRNPEGDPNSLKWRYTLWDLDATFGHYINYTNIPDQTPNADPCDNEALNNNSDPQGHVDLIISLLENEDFHSLYVNRYADMNNSFFTCDYMIGLLDTMIATIEPEMQRQIDRWGGSYNGWQDAVQELKDFILTRCTVINGGIEDCYDVMGPYPVTVKVEPANEANRVRVNTFIPADFPFQGDYWGGTTLTFDAFPIPGWELDHWEVDSNAFTPNQYANTIKVPLGEIGEVVTAFFRPSIPCADAFELVVDSTLSSLVLNWDGPPNILSYEVNWRVAGTNDEWEVVSVLDPTHTIFGLEVCTDYEIRVRSICENGLGDYLIYPAKTHCLTGAEEAIAGIYEMNAFPNPFEDHLFVDFILANRADVTVELIGLRGEIIHSQQLNNLTQGQHKVDLNVDDNLSTGVYFVRILTNQGMKVARVIKH